MLPIPTPNDTALDALGNPTRRAIVLMLGRRPRSVGELAGALPVSRPAVSRHLRLLQDAGLVCHQRRGTRNLYRLDRAGFDAARDWLDQFWAEALDNFAALVDEEGEE